MASYNTLVQTEHTWIRINIGIPL